MRLLTLAGLLLTLLLAALDQTRFATALPSSAAELSDQLGRKPLLVGRSLAFLVASLACAQARRFL